MEKMIGIGLLGLGTVGAGVAKIIQTPDGRNPLIQNIQLRKVAVKTLNKPRSISIDKEILTENPQEVVIDPFVDVVVEVMGGIEPARSLILEAIPDASIEIKDLMGDNNHYSAIIKSKVFKGMSKIEQHKLVYKSLKGKMGNELHALSITTMEK